MQRKYKRLTLEDRIQIEKGLSQKQSYETIGNQLGYSKSSIYREVLPWGKDKYEAVKADTSAQKSASKRKKGYKKLLKNNPLREFVVEKLALSWSPEKISNKLKLDYPQQYEKHASYETIYRYMATM